MDYDLLEQAITEKTKVIIPVELAGIVCDYDRLFQVVEKKRDFFTASSKWQKAFNRIVIVSDSAHALGSTYKGQPSGSIADFTSFSFHAVKNFTTAEGGSATWKANPVIDDEEMYKEFQILSFTGKLRMLLPRCNWGHGNTISLHQPISAT